MLGYDPDEAPDEIIEALSDVEDRVGDEAIEEAATALPGAQAPDVLKNVVEATTASDVVVDLRIVEQLSVELPGGLKAAPPWEEAERAAVTMRRVLGRASGPIRGQPLADALGLTWNSVTNARATAAGLPYAGRSDPDRDGANQRISLQTQSSSGRRFELARALADAIWTDHARFGVMSRARTGRQKFQRAFAQSFLCPFPDLLEHVDTDDPTEEQIIGAAKYFHVSQTVVRTTLVNKGILPRERLGDQLEAA